MDDSTKTMITTLATGAVTKILIAGGAAATAHGFATGVPAETYSAIAVMIVATGGSVWRDYGKAIVLSQLEVLKARSLAAAAKIKDAGLPSVTTAEVAAQNPKLTSESVTKVAATLPANVQASIVPAKENPAP